MIGDIPDVEPELRAGPRRRYEIYRAGSGAEALSLLRTVSFDVLVGDAGTWAETSPLLESLQGADNRPMVIAASAEAGGGWLATNVHERLERPFTAAKILHSIDRAVEYADLLSQNRVLVARVRQNDPIESLTAASEAMRRVCERLRVVAASNAAVLITGETGTGKELAAREIHRLSGQSGAFIKLDCAAAPDVLLDKQLFGNAGEAGLLEQARGGTLLLDEVDRLPLLVQGRLAQILDVEGYERSGPAGMPRGGTTRVVSTTRQVLKEKITTGSFREDLYYRLSVVPLVMPALRERRDDIPLLTAYFVRCAAAESGNSGVRLSPAAVDKLRGAYWRGNVRELRNVVERAVLLSPSGTVNADDLHFDDERDERLSRVEHAFRFGSVRDMEKLMILNRLREHGDNRTHASKTLEISVRTLRNKLREYRETGDR